MKYRDFPAAGRKVSTLGMGCMRMPMTNEEGHPIDRPEAIKLIRHLIDGGVSYIDTAYPYHNGQSEGLVGEALKDGYRERVTLATKLPVWMVKKREDMERFLDEQLKRLGVDYVDVYLAHALDGKRFDTIRELGLFEFMDEMVKKGNIRYPGFSFHDEADQFRRIVDSYDWKVAQVQMNLLDEFHQATMDGVRYAAGKGIRIVVMEPVRGGSLVKTVPDEIRALYEAAVPGRSAAEWAFRWLIDKPEFMTILSGMSDLAQADDNLRIFDSAEAGCLSEMEKETLEKVRKAYEARIRVGCTGCEYCMPCPQGIQIPRIFREYDTASMFGDFESFRRRYNAMEVHADTCVGCEACVAACPQHFKTPIPEMLKQIHEENIDR